jgi:sugar transferase (PEP-CTERM/EpsH1 system associated)
LAARHEVALLSFAEFGAELNGRVAHLKTECKKVEVVPFNYRFAGLKEIGALFSHDSLNVRAFSSKRFLNTFRLLVQDFGPDYILTDSSMMAFYPLQLKLPFIADFMDVDSEKWAEFGNHSKWPLSWIYRVEAKRLAQFEKEAATQAEAVLVVSEAEKAKLNSFAPQARINVIPNGVDRDYFKPLGRIPIPGRIVFTGVMDYPPNVDAVQWFCHAIWPLIRSHVPHATFSIVGANPSLRLRALGRFPGVHVTGTVPDVRPYIDEAEICVAPLRFSIGLQNKVLEALAMGKGVVATLEAVQGLARGVEKVVKIEDNSGNFANSVAQLITDPNKRKEYEVAGPAFVAKRHDWDQNLKVLQGYL